MFVLLDVALVRLLLLIMLKMCLKLLIVIWEMLSIRFLAVFLFAYDFVKVLRTSISFLFASSHLVLWYFRVLLFLSFSLFFSDFTLNLSILYFTSRFTKEFAFRNQCLGDTQNHLSPTL